jgi:hypothetical protein
MSVRVSETAIGNGSGNVQGIDAVHTDRDRIDQINEDADLTKIGSCPDPLLLPIK